MQTNRNSADLVLRVVLPNTISSNAVCSWKSGVKTEGVIERGEGHMRRSVEHASSGASST